MGEGFTWDTQDRARDIAAAKAAWDIAQAMIADPSYRMVLLDELNIVLRYGYLPGDGRRLHLGHPGPRPRHRRRQGGLGYSAGDDRRSQLPHGAARRAQHRAALRLSAGRWAKASPGTPRTAPATSPPPRRPGI